MQTDTENNKYWNGSYNRAVRYYFYIQRGLFVLNEFRYLIMAILALYALLDLKDPYVMVIMFFVSVPVLGVAGWFYTFKMAKIMDWLNIKYSTHYSKYSIELQERQTAAIESIEERIKNVSIQ